jgi:tRNA threonylcarbamoyl adenosine modification protein (Sua5/YciO/YrdC/YwlC family)
VPADEVIEALRAGRPVLLPTDTVYGLAATADDARGVDALYRLKGREQRQPVALIAASVAQLFDRLPELRDGSLAIVRALLPGPFTLVLANPARRYSWLTGARPDTIGVRVPALAGEARDVLDAVGCVAATSANDPGGPDPVSLDDVPARIRGGCGAELDAGRLPGIASTVLDFTGPEPRVLREGAAPSAEALARVRAALSS